MSPFPTESCRKAALTPQRSFCQDFLTKVTAATPKSQLCPLLGWFLPNCQGTIPWKLLNPPQEIPAMDCPSAALPSSHCREQSILRNHLELTSGHGKTTGPGWSSLGEWEVSLDMAGMGFKSPTTQSIPGFCDSVTSAGNLVFPQSCKVLLQSFSKLCGAESRKKPQT